MTKLTKDLDTKVSWRTCRFFPDFLLLSVWECCNRTFWSLTQTDTDPLSWTPSQHALVQLQGWPNRERNICIAVKYELCGWTTKNDDVTLLKNVAVSQSSNVSWASQKSTTESINNWKSWRIKKAKTHQQAPKSLSGLIWVSPLGEYTKARCSAAYTLRSGWDHLALNGDGKWSPMFRQCLRSASRCAR